MANKNFFRSKILQTEFKYSYPSQRYCNFCTRTAEVPVFPRKNHFDITKPNSSFQPPPPFLTDKKSYCQYWVCLCHFSQQFLSLLRHNGLPSQVVQTIQDLYLKFLSSCLICTLFEQTTQSLLASVTAITWYAPSSLLASTSDSVPPFHEMIVQQ